MVKRNLNLVQAQLEIFVAGEWVAPGTYQHIESTRIIRLEQADYLPASLDGRVACYQRAQPTWGQRQQQSAETRHS